VTLSTAVSEASLAQMLKEVLSKIENITVTNYAGLVIKPKMTEEVGSSTMPNVNKSNTAEVFKDFRIKIKPPSIHENLGQKISIHK
jgi:hypothetical protein